MTRAGPRRGTAAAASAAGDGTTVVEHLDPRAPVVELLGVVATAAEAYDRADLAERASVTRAHLDHTEIRVVVAGEFKRGKSTLVNALLGAEVCPVDDDIATAVPILVRHAAEPGAVVVTGGDESADPPELVEHRVEVAALADWVSEAGNPGNRRGVHWADVGIPRKLLADGLVLVDTPGVGGLDSAHGSLTLSALAGADAVLLVTDTSQELTAAEVDFLRSAVELCPTVTVVSTKTDLYPAWRTIVASDKAVLDREGFAVEVLAVSSALRSLAAATVDRSLNDESGFPTLHAHLTGEILAGAGARAAAMAADTATEIIRRLREPFAAELEVLDDPEAAERRRVRLEEASAAAAELQERGARWQVLLNDGCADLNAEVDHDLRERFRRLGRELEERIDEIEPAKAWDEISAWLTRQAASEVAANHGVLLERTAQLADDLVEQFRVGGIEPRLPTVELADPFDALGEVSVDAPEVATDDGGVARRAGASILTGAKGSYGYVMMITMGAGMIGLSVAAPIMAGAALGLGRKAVKDEHKRKLTQERQQAKAAGRRYLDDVSFAAGKSSRDALRSVQRFLRDELGVLAGEVAAQVQAEVAAAKAAGGGDIEQRRADVAAELARLDHLASKLDAARPRAHP
ncbi:MAG: dynamin family protein [Acidimicrobiia bacterium]|nr:dynamin family protein [Acidimicrobiia bacterium]